MPDAAMEERSRDEDLVLRHRYGDETAFREVFDRFQGMVYNVALRMCGNEVEAQDLSQEALIRVYRHLGKFRAGSALKTWIYRITMNVCYSKLGRKRLPTVDLDDENRAAPLQLVDDGRTPEQRAIGVGEQARVRRALTQLEAPFRQAVILRDLEDLSYQEIAEVLSVNIGTVRSRIARGRAKLREILESEE